MRMLTRLGTSLGEAARHAEAIPPLLEALATSAELGDPGNRMLILDRLA
ncbi:hypothetical protein [Streptomyces tateyamensis]|nr:hypothetical protein [Streptomyces tateyamensis]